MSLRLFYIDESHDSNLFCLSAISIRYVDWNECFDIVRKHRKELKDQDGVYLRKEIHANELVSGHGKYSDQVLGKHQRSRIFFSLLDLITHFPNVFVINVAIPKRGCKDPELVAWDRLVNRIERTLRAFDRRSSI